MTPEVDRVVLKALDKSSSRRHLTLRLFLSEVEALVAPATGPAAGAASGKDAPPGFAKTMLFAGGQAEVANLVARAIASRTGSPAAGVPRGTGGRRSAGRHRGHRRQPSSRLARDGHRRNAGGDLTRPPGGGLGVQRLDHERGRPSVVGPVRPQRQRRHRRWGRLNAG